MAEIKAKSFNTYYDYDDIELEGKELEDYIIKDVESKGSKHNLKYCSTEVQVLELDTDYFESVELITSTGPTKLHALENLVNFFSIDFDGSGTSPNLNDSDEERLKVASDYLRDYFGFDLDVEDPDEIPTSINLT